MKARSGISAAGLKWIAIFAMIIDHVAWKLSAPTPVIFTMHLVGRFTMPIMCFFIAEGFRHTRSRGRYALRLLVFALVSQIPYNYCFFGDPFHFEMGPEYFNVLFCLLLGLCALWAVKSELKPGARIALAALCLLASALCDWPMFGVLFVLAFGLNSGSFKRQALWFSLAAAVFIIALNVYNFLMGEEMRFYAIGLFLPLLPLALYNGKKSGAPARAWKTAASKWLFYVIYPLHLAALGFLHYGLGWLK